MPRSKKIQGLNNLNQQVEAARQQQKPVTFQKEANVILPSREDALETLALLVKQHELARDTENSTFLRTLYHAVWNEQIKWSE